MDSWQSVLTETALGGLSLSSILDLEEFGGCLTWLPIGMIADLVGSVSTHSSSPLAQSLQETSSELRAGSVFHSMAQLCVLGTSCIGSSWCIC